MILAIVAVVLVFATVAMLIYAIIGQRQAGADPVAARLAEIKTSSESGSWWQTRRAARRPIWERLLARLAGFLPNADGQESLRDGLIEAGYRSQNAVTTFLGAKVLFAVALPFGFLFLMAALRQPIANTIVWTVVLAVVGFYLPTLWLWQKSNERKLEITHALPDALDLMVVCVEAGLGLNAAIVKVSQEITLASPVLAQELRQVNNEMKAGINRIDALRGLADRTGVADVKSLVAVLVQTDRLGTSVAQSLRAQSDSLRVKRRQRAEEAAHKVAVKLVFPLVLCIFPELLLILLGPGMLQIYRALSNVGRQ
ncbi:MAG: type II secretion system F family protein [Candidatus Eiseniibacteriota bacterium]